MVKECNQLHLHQTVCIWYEQRSSKWKWRDQMQKYDKTIQKWIRKNDYKMIENDYKRKHKRT